MSDAVAFVSTDSEATFISAENSTTFVVAEREVTFVQVGVQGPSGATTTVDDIGSLIEGAGTKTTPVDADSFGLSDSESSGILRKFTWASLKTAINGIFARLSGIAGGQTLIGGTGAGDALTLQGTSATGTTGTDSALRILSGDNGGSTALTLLNNGNVGLGVSNPLDQLVVGAVTPVALLSSGRLAIGTNRGLGAYRGYLDVGGTFPDDNSYRWAGLSYTLNLAPTITGSMTRYGVYGAISIPAGNSQTMTASVRGLQSTVADAGSGNLSGGIYGAFNSVACSGSGAKGAINAFNNQVSISGTVSASSIIGINGVFGVSSAGASCTSLYGASFGGTNAGSVTNYYGFRSNMINTGAIGTSYGMYVDYTNTGTVTNHTALFIGSGSNTGSNPKAIDCQSAAPSTFMGAVAVGVTTPSAKLHSLSTTEQLRLAYDAANYASFTISSTGVLSLTTTGSSPALLLSGDVRFDKTITAAGTPGSQTIHKTMGSVNFAAGATSLVVTNNRVSASSCVFPTIATNDATMKSVTAVAGSSSFTLYAGVAPTAETRVNFIVFN